VVLQYGKSAKAALHSDNHGIALMYIRDVSFKVNYSPTDVCRFFDEALDQNLNLVQEKINAGGSRGVFFV
jgi:hypothetical protein